MGARLWRYFVEYQPDVALALRLLRQREFEARRYDIAGVEPGAPVRTADDIVPECLVDSGTRSVLDMAGGVSDSPRDYCVSPLARERLLELFGTERPTRELVERSYGPPEYVRGTRSPRIPDRIARGQGVYVVVFETDVPREIFFCGYSFD